MNKARAERLTFVEQAAEFEGPGCLLWPYTTTGIPERPYGTIMYKGKRWAAHRLILTLAVGPAPFPKADAAHAPGVCHNARCVNPQHLRWATRAENLADRAIDGTAPKGMRNPASKLDDDKVRAIRADPRSAAMIAKDYDISTNVAWLVKSRRIWTHVSDAA